MKKCVISLILAALMCVSLCVGAFAEGDTPEQAAAAEDTGLKDKAWDVALKLSDAADCYVRSYAEMSGQAAGSGYDETFKMMTISNVDAAFADGGRTSSTRYYVSGSSSVSKEYTVAEVPELGVYYWDKTITGTRDEGQVVEHYDAAPEDAFCDFATQIAMHLAALGDDLLGAQEEPGDLAAYVEPAFVYELQGDSLRDLVLAFCPELVKGCGELDWTQLSAQMHTELSGESVSIDLSSPSLAEAILGSLKDVETVSDGALDIEITVMVLHDNYSQYKDNHYTQEKLDQTGLSFAETGGTCPTVPSLTDMIWKVCEPGWNAANETESARDALRAQLAGDAPAQAEEDAGE